MWLSALLEQGRAAGAFPMGAVWVWCGDEVWGEGFCGGASAETRWDLASLTKPIAVGTLAMEAVSDGRIRLGEVAVDGLWPSVVVGGPPEAKAGVGELTWEALLGHRAGLPAWKDLVEALPEPRVPGSEAARYAVMALVRMAARERESGGGVEYSDLGYILLGDALEKCLGTTLQAVSGLGGVYCPGGGGGGFAPTGWCPWRRREVGPGEVHDPNAWVMGGVAGHAGLFGTTGSVGHWASGLLLRSEGRATGDMRLDGIAPNVVNDFWRLSRRGLTRTGAPSTWVLGWDTPSVASSAGRHVSPDAVGHLGFTGTSVWVDRTRRMVVVLLTNRVALGAAALTPWKAFRPHLHETIYEHAAPSR